MTEYRPLHSPRFEASLIAEDTSTSVSANIFPPTDWELVLSARNESRSALERLWKCYWGPAYAFFRRAGYEREAARELIDQFFAELAEQDALSPLKNGPQPFRVWLLSALEKFLGSRQSGRARPTAVQRLPLDDAVAEAIDRTGNDVLEPQREFERVLAVSVLERAIWRLDRDQADRGQSQRFLALKPWLIAEPSEVELSSVANVLGLRLTSARMARHALRQRLAYFVQQEIANLLERRDDTEGLQAEMAALLGALAS